MFNDFFATYNQVSPPPKMPILNTTIEEEHVEAYNPVAKTFVAQITPQVVEEIQTAREKKPTTKTQVKKAELKGSAGFERAFAEAVKRDPSVSKYKNYLVRTAKRESGFNSYIQNQAGAPYYGYFQMGKDEIKSTTGMTVEQFRNDPVAQILGAVKLYEMNLSTMKRNGAYSLGKARGYSDDALVAGAWLAGPGGVNKYLKGLGDPSDSHWYNNHGGTSVSQIMNNWMRSK